MKNIVALFKQTFQEFSEDKAPRLGAALAYYTIFSIAPLLLIAIAIAGMVFGREAAQGEILGQLRGVLGTSAADSIQEMIKSAAKPKAGTIATIIGVITLIFGASGVFTQLKDALNTIWNVPPKKSSGVMSMLREKFLSVSMVFGVGFLLLVSLVIDTAISVVGKYASSHLPGGQLLWQVLQLIVSLGVVTVLFAMIFRFLPDVKVEWRDVWYGAAFTAVLFVLGKLGLGLYIGKAAVGSSFGAAGSLVVLLVWVYWSAQILFIGAEFTQVYARTHGSMKDAPAPNDAASPATAAADQKKNEKPAKPTIVYTPQPSNAGAKMAVGGAAGLALGTLVGGVAAVIMLVKTAKKLIS